MKTAQKRDEFNLRISGVSNGKHQFSIVCDKTFFEIADITEVEDGLLNLTIDLQKSETMLQLSFHFQGKVEVACDRCLEILSLPLDFDDELIVKYSAFIDELEVEDDQIWVVPENEYELDVFHFVYESIILALPIQVFHPDDENGNSTCNPEVLEQLNNLSQKESSHEDPRWEGLKNLDLN